MKTVTRDKEHLTTFPDEIIAQNKQVQLLSLDKNGISEIPSKISELTELTSFSISQNKISKIPSELFALKNLQRLVFAQNSISSIPEIIDSLINLTELNMCCNKLSALPASITSLTNLIKLNVISNFLTELPRNISTLSRLTYIGLSQNDFHVLPPSLFSLSGLNELDTEFNNYSVIPPEISHLSNLTRLNVRGNEIENLPNEMTCLSNLEILTVDNNPLTQITFSQKVFPKLREFNMNSTKSPKFDENEGPANIKKISAIDAGLGRLPASFSKFENLEDFDVTGNRLDKIPIVPRRVAMCRVNCNELKRIDFEENSNIQFFYGKHNTLEEIPVGLLNVTRMNACDLSWNRIKSFNPRISWIRLQVLDLSFNELSVIDMTISKLVNLKRLNLSFNSIVSVPNYISNLSSLERFYIAGNKLKDLPNEMESLVELTVLHLGENQFNEIPPVIIKIPHLLRLHICCNPIYDVNSLSVLTGLNTLDIANCYVKNCEFVNGMKELQQLCLANNYISKPPTFGENCSKLVHVDVSFNALSEMPNFENPANLAFLDCSYNDLDFFKEFNKFEVFGRKRGVLESTLDMKKKKEVVVRVDGCIRLKQYKFLNRFADLLKFRSVPTTLSTAQMCSDRDEMQDSMLCIPNFAGPDHFLLGVADGHYGVQTAYYFNVMFPDIFYEVLKKPITIEEAFKEAFEVIQCEFVKMGVKDGACVTVVFLTPLKIYTAQCGDCRAVYVTSEKAIQLCTEHEPTMKMEQKRIKKAGGFVDAAGRVSGLRVSRSVGDIENKPVLTHIPETTVYDRGSDEEYLIVASDGLWDEVTNEMAYQLLHSKRSIFRTGELASMMKDLAFISCSSDQSADNISIVLCRF
ncbi:leucine-rich repeat containing protein, putative [Entamoeba invadens IP1]|uniref:Leucine-rich repeat containing protein, putative n=1 Tax=Entamoeba invadens IP1 TaxID=370355 RepID=A0A0A1UGD2_ENTIV|nr:leucine-rich repeat containing protein, putative [Entamoeba invadens IP1]ELP94789.1 leucine-rich repeat containing protein, putative [Entamoeba invadens IP1]|eukprot:XP_004261560.1 leucine-rich repeat containing protein, putative [Entamoeba invadens IP1]